MSAATVEVLADGSRSIALLHQWVITAAEWERLRQAKPEIGECWPDGTGDRMVIVGYQQDDGRQSTLTINSDHWSDLRKYF
jgi:hypothetical protein